MTGDPDVTGPDATVKRAVAEPLCSACGEAVTPTDVFCESCGHQLPTGSVPAVVPPAHPESVGPDGHALPGGEAAAGGRPCGNCGAPAQVIDADGYCGQCGIRQSPTADHLETDLGIAAAISDRGHRHRRNEDAYAISVSGERTTIVICDGVSSTANPDQASAAAARAALDTIELALEDREWPGTQAVGDLLTEAISQAHKAVAEVPAVEPGGYAALPSTTIVTAIVAPGAVVVANIGDSRAYWLAPVPGESRQLSVDDSWAEGAIAAGMAPEQAYAAPAAHIITQWLGADSGEPRPHVSALTVDEAGTVLICSDGLWNYFESPEHLASLTSAAGPDASPLIVAGHLVEAALDAGGHDNITVAVIPGRPAHQATTEPQE